MDIQYWVRAAKAFLRGLKRPGFLASVMRSGLIAESRPAAQTVDFLDAYPSAESIAVELGKVTFRRSNLDPMEQYVVATIARVHQPATIFEFGTYDGATTLLLSRNLPEARIFTLDLDPALATRATVASESTNALHGVGFRFGGHLESERIEQLLGDSRNFDFSPWYGEIDLVVIDGGHEYETVASDTASAVRLLRPGGVIIWDDYMPGWPGVVRAVEESGLNVFRISSTNLAIYDERSFVR